jgi:CubicO group peptidase (beta-lactamase class C family)
MDMRSGIAFREGSYNLKDDAVKLGFRTNLEKHALKRDLALAPGKKFEYKSVNTALLAIALERATGKSLSDYLEEKLWKPLGSTSHATWNVDSRKHSQEIGYAGLNATARDFARLGTLFLHRGNWYGKRIFSEKWMNAFHPDTLAINGGYKQHWWSRNAYMYFTDSSEAYSFAKSKKYTGLVRKTRNRWRVPYRTSAFSAQGVLNQVIYINPQNNVVIVRFGRFWSHSLMQTDEFIYNLGERL